MTPLKYCVKYKSHIFEFFKGPSDSLNTQQTLGKSKIKEAGLKSGSRRPGKAASLGPTRHTWIQFPATTLGYSRKSVTKEFY